MERRGRIPVAKFRTLESKTRSRSRVREPDYNEQDPETDLFTLIEDNIALKEDNKELKLQLEQDKNMQNDLKAENVKLIKEVEELKQKYELLQTNLNDLKAKYDDVKKESNNLEQQYKKKVDKVTSLMHELKVAQECQQKTMVSTRESLIPSQTLKSKLLKILPTSSSCSGAGNNTSTDLESILDVDAFSTMPLTNDVIEQLTDEFLAMKNSLNTLELQLYEANEKISELVENQYHLEEENESLRSENSNLTKVAKLLTQNMKESVETSKKMEAALFKLKQRNEQLTSTNRDLIDGQSDNQAKPPGDSEAEESVRKVEVSTSSIIADTATNTPLHRQSGGNHTENPNREQGERIVEMQSLIGAANVINGNEELECLRLKVQIMEEELRLAIRRAEAAEKQIKLYEDYNLQTVNTTPTPQTSLSSPPPLSPPPPPPPPPMPPGLLYKLPSAAEHQHYSIGPTISTSTNLYKTLETDDDHKRIDSIKRFTKKPEAATGVDALVRELKSGRVTLRRQRRKTRTSEALQEMFETLDISQRQNRNSKICINMNL